jgi:predicted XRE-type DNA-binding protein
MQQNFIPRIDFEIDPVTGCFNCTSHKPGKRGYPRFNVDIDGEKKCTPVHRVVYEFFNGKIPKNRNVVVRHLCDNKMCINPKHLSLGSQQDNLNDAKRNRRIPRGEQRSNAKLTAEKVAEIKKLYREKKYNQYELSPLFGVSRGCICSIVRGKSWVHVL